MTWRTRDGDLAAWLYSVGWPRSEPQEEKGTTYFPFEESERLHDEVSQYFSKTRGKFRENRKWVRGKTLKKLSGNQ